MVTTLQELKEDVDALETINDYVKANHVQHQGEKILAVTLMFIARQSKKL